MILLCTESNSIVISYFVNYIRIYTRPADPGHGIRFCPFLCFCFSRGLQLLYSKIRPKNSHSSKDKNFK